MSTEAITQGDVIRALRSAKLHPSIPELVAAIINITQSKRTNLSDLVAVIEQDEDLSSRLLSMANSGFFGPERKVRRVTDAVVLMGWNNVKMISLGSTIMKVISQLDQRLYSHAIRTAQFANFLGTEANLYKIEDITLVGLLHNIGAVILRAYFKDQALQAKQYAIKEGVPIQVAERAVFGADHAEIGRWTADEWHLPTNIIETIAEHHDFSRKSFHAKKTAAIHVAESLAMVSDYYGPSWEKINPIDPEAIATLGFSEVEFKEKAMKCLKTRFDPLIL